MSNSKVMHLDFSKGQEICWLHGEYHRVAVVVEVNKDSVKLSGMTSEYWIKKSTLIKKINRSYPVGTTSF